MELTVRTLMPEALAISAVCIPASANIRQRRCSVRVSVRAILRMVSTSSLSSRECPSTGAGRVCSWLMVSDVWGLRCSLRHTLMHSCLAICTARRSASCGEDKVPHAFQRRITVSCAMSSASPSDEKKFMPMAFAFSRNAGAKRANSVCSIHQYNVEGKGMLCGVKKD